MSYIYIAIITGYLGERHLSQTATLLYLVSLLLPSLTYAALHRVIRRSGVHGDCARDYHRATIRKGNAVFIIYVAGIALTFITPLLGIACGTLWRSCGSCR